MLDRRTLLGLFIGFLVLTALVASFSVVSGQFGELQIKVLISTFSVSAASVTAMASAAYAERSGRGWVAIGAVGLNGLTIVLLLFAVWGESDLQLLWETVVSLIFLTLGIAHGCLLLLPRLADSHRWIQVAGVAMVGLLVVLLDGIVWYEIYDDGDYFRAVALVAIVVVLVTLVIPILRRLDADSSPPVPSELHLTEISDGSYVDPRGRRYRVQPLD